MTGAGQEVADWVVSPGRTAVAVREPGLSGRVGVARLDPGGRLGAPTWIPGTGHVGWTVAGWADEDVVVLWRRDAGRVLFGLADTGRGVIDTHPLVGRPVAARTGGDGGPEVLVVVADRAGPVLCLHRPDAGTYQVLDATAGVRSVAGWDPGRRVLVLNRDTTPEVCVIGYDEQGSRELPVDWPEGCRPVAAVGDGPVVGLTGTDDAGRVIPGLLDLRAGTVRWFAGHTGHTCVEAAPSGRRLLAVTWEDHRYLYRVLDPHGAEVGRVRPADGLATDLRFAADEAHALGWYQSPARQGGIVAWALDTGTELAAAGAVAPGAIRWWHRQGGEHAVPEWVFEPLTGGHGGVVVYLHGGPHSRLNQGYEPVIAALVDDGWTVVGLNYPGSTGYGAAFRDATVGDWGGADAAVVAERVRELRAEGARPVCLYGNSYGGYLALLVAAADPAVADAVAVWAPITDLPLLAEEATGVRRRWLESELGEQLAAPARLHERSPVARQAALARLPVLLGHGRGDDRCPVSQSRRLAALLGDGPDLRYLEDAGGTHTPSNWLWWADAVAGHLRPHVVRAAASAGRGTGS